MGKGVAEDGGAAITLRQDAIDEIGSGQVKVVLRNRVAGVSQQALGLLREDLRRHQRFALRSPVGGPAVGGTGVELGVTVALGDGVHSLSSGWRWGGY